MKNLIIEHFEIDDMPSELLGIVARRFSTNQELWTGYHNAHKFGNGLDTIMRFFDLKAGDNVIGAARFEDINHVHFFVLVMHKMRKFNKKLNVYLYHPNLRLAFDKYLLMDKPEMLNIQLVESINFHNVYSVRHGKPDELIKFDAIKHELTVEVKSEPIVDELLYDVATKASCHKAVKYDYYFNDRLSPIPHSGVVIPMHYKVPSLVIGL